MLGKAHDRRYQGHRYGPACRISCPQLTEGRAMSCYEARDYDCVALRNHLWRSRTVALLHHDPAIESEGCGR